MGLGEKAKVKRQQISDCNGRTYFLRYLLPFAFLLLLLNFLTACNETFEPYQENDTYFFSMYGYLDASADTQWIRVAPARQEFNMPPEVPDMEVTLEHVQSGNTVIMVDSLVTPDNSFNYLNFSTTMDIRNSETYRLRAERLDGSASQVTATTPEEFPTPRLLEQESFGQPTTYLLYVDDVERLAEVQTKWYVRLTVGDSFEEDKIVSFSYRNSVEQISENDYTLLIEPEEEMEQIAQQIIVPAGGEIQVVHRQIFVASGGPEWDEDIASLDDLIYALPEGFSNVEDGLGYMVGVDFKIIPYESCFDEQFVLIPCEEEEPFW